MMGESPGPPGLPPGAFCGSDGSGVPDGGAWRCGSGGSSTGGTGGIDLGSGSPYDGTGASDGPGEVSWMGVIVETP